MSDLETTVPAQYVGTETVRLAKGQDGPRDYVQGRGADYVPSRTGPGDVYVVDDDSEGDDVNVIRFDGVNEDGAKALRLAAQEVVNGGRVLTREEILKQLR